MKPLIQKCMIAVSVICFAALNAEAAFRIKEPSAEVRQQALMSIQSTGTSEDETVETTTVDEPFTVDFSALDADSAENAYLLIVNEQTGNAIALEAEGTETTQVELPPLVLAELEMQHLGAGQRYRCMAMCATEDGKDEVLGSALLASSLADVNFPNFNYLAEDGTVKETTLSDRKLVGYRLAEPSYILANPDDPDARARAAARAKENEYYVYEYALPGGGLMSYDEEMASTGEDHISFQSANLTFNAYITIPERARTATIYALKIWSSTLVGRVPVTVAIEFRDLGEPETLGGSYAPDAGLVNGVYYPEAIYSQKLGKDASSTHDIRLVFNTRFPWYFGTDGNCGTSYDYVTVLLHELCHGLGFYDSILYEHGGVFAYGSYPTIYDTYLYYNGEKVVNLTPAQRVRAITSNALYFDAPTVKAENGGSRPKMYAPYEYDKGSSVSHWDGSVSFKTFMRYRYVNANHEISAIKKAAMKDLGWQLASSTPSQPSTPKLPAPTGVVATKGTIMNGVDLSWNAVSGASSYTVYRATSANGTYSVQKSGITTCSYQDRSISGATTYYYRVAAHNISGNGEQSAYASGYALTDASLSSIEITGPATLNAFQTAPYTCIARYTNGVTRDVSLTTGCKWSLPYGGSYATLSQNRVSAAYGITEQKAATIRVTYSGKTAEKSITLLPTDVLVTFDAGQHGEPSFTSRKYAVESCYYVLPTVSNVTYGYKFLGWFTAASGGTQVTSLSDVSPVITKLYAQYSREVVITSVRVDVPSTIECGSSHTVNCYVKDSSGSERKVTTGVQWSVSGSGLPYVLLNGTLTLNPSKTSTGTIQISATVDGVKSETVMVTSVNPTKTITLDANGGTVAVASISQKQGKMFTTLPVATRENYTFLGWYTARTSGTKIENGTSYTGAYTTLYAHWEADLIEPTKIEIEANATSVVSGATITLKCYVTHKTVETTRRTLLSGADVKWSVSNAAAGTVSAAGIFTASRVTSQTSVSITATYKEMTAPAVTITINPETVTVSFKANGGSVSQSSRSYVLGVPYGELPTPTYDSDHCFDGWFTASSGGTRVTAMTVCEKHVTTLYAHWSEVTTLTSLKIVGETEVTASVPAKFVCYAVYSDGTEIVVTPEWDVGDPSSGTIDTEGLFTASYVVEPTPVKLLATEDGIVGELNVVVYPKEISVRFDPCDGAVSPQRMTYIVGATYDELPMPIRSRYDFDGWYTLEAKGGELITETSVVDEEIETLYAGWTPTAYPLTGIQIDGVETVMSGGSAVFSCKANYSNGSEGSIVPVWSIVEGQEYASLTLGGSFTAVEVSSEKVVTIQAVYTDRGIRYEDQHKVKIVPSTLVVDPGAISLEADAQKASIFIDAYDKWTVSTDVSWITLEKTSGTGIDTINFTVTANTGSEERTGTITVKSGDLSEKCIVKQYSPIPDEYVMVTLDTKIPGQTPSTRQYIKGRKFAYLPTPVRTGYAFGGWWTKPNGGGTRIHAMSIVSDSVLTLYGHWTDVSIAYALNNALDWVEDTVNPWIFDYTEARDRKVSMTSPILNNSQKSSLSALVEGPGTISFSWKTSSEEYFDVLSVYVDGKFISSISGESGWQAFSAEISGYGQHVISWVYSKDGQNASGMDCAWLDLVTWMPDYAGSGASSIQSVDGKAIPETWLNSFGLETSASIVTEDADGDGMTNYEEYIAGTDPLDQESNFKVYIEITAEGLPLIEAVPNLGDSDMRTYIFEGKESLADEEWSVADETVHRFFRVRIEVK